MVRGATLIHGLIPVRLQDTTISPTTDVCPTLRNTLPRISSAPSAVHLTTCFLPGSQPPGLSVKSLVAVISASLVYDSLLQNFCFVNRGKRIFAREQPPVRAALIHALNSQSSSASSIKSSGQTNCSTIFPSSSYSINV